MSDVGKSERVTQNRIIELFRDELGYRFLGDWIDREGNSNIEEQILSDYLTKHGYSTALRQDLDPLGRDHCQSKGKGNRI